MHRNIISNILPQLTYIVQDKLLERRREYSIDYLQDIDLERSPLEITRYL